LPWGPTSASFLKPREWADAIARAHGAATALATNAGPATAQDSKAATGKPQGTVYTGEVIQGKKVVSALDVNELTPGQKHLFAEQWQYLCGLLLGNYGIGPPLLAAASLEPR
jgi:hypothetical protein